MAILAFDTCLRSVSVAINIEGRVSGRIEACESGHAERLLPMIEAVLADAGLTFADVTRVAVTLGPGGFTGLRVGISAARAFALALGVPVVGLTSLHVAALVASSRLAAESYTGRFVVAAPAGRGAAFAQVFEGKPVSPVGPPRLIWPDGKVSDLADTIVLGPGADLLDGRSPGLRALPDFTTLQPDAAALAQLAPDLAPLAVVLPIYLRAADAKPPSGKGLARAIDSRHS